ncbi:amidohydrolase family protein [Hymenobacter humi]|uniref:Amidohydrolase family protein n=1 Tax=Hymenobacter humi TaxID=1411620 RepID=A0ABW2U9E9_9BACT
MKLLLLVAAQLLLVSGAAAQAAPDLVLTGGKVFTADPARPYAQALAVRGERIVAVGSTADISKLAGPRTRRIDLRGRTVVPGFNDAHTHLPPGNPLGRFFRFPKAPVLAGPSSAQVLDTLAKLARRVPPGTWLEGEVGLTALLDPQVRRAELDQITATHPVMLHTPWGTAAWSIRWRCSSCASPTATRPPWRRLRTLPGHQSAQRLAAGIRQLGPAPRAERPGARRLVGAAAASLWR